MTIRSTSTNTSDSLDTVETAISQTIFVVDDDPAVLHSVGLALRPLGMTVKTYSSGEAFLEAYDPPCPGCLVLDVRMPGMSGIELQRKIASEHPYLSVVMVTGHATVPISVSVLRNGAVDFLEKPYVPDDLRASVIKAVNQSTRLWHEQRNRDDYSSQLSKLSPRERQVYELLLQGRENKQVAIELGISPSTVEKHRLAVLRKMDVDNVTQLLRQKIDSEGGLE